MLFRVGRLLVCLALLANANCAQSFERYAQKHLLMEAHYVPTQGFEWSLEFQVLVDLLNKNGISVNHVNELEFFGANLNHQVIMLRAEMPMNAKFETLAHEAGHSFDFYHDKATSELFAEMVGIGIQEFYGKMDAKDKGWNYLLLHKQAAGNLKFIRKDIDYAIQILTGQIPWPKSQ